MKEELDGERVVEEVGFVLVVGTALEASLIIVGVQDKVKTISVGK